MTSRPTAFSYSPAVEITVEQHTTPPIVAYRIWQVRNPEYGLRGIHPLCPAPWEHRREHASCLAPSIAARACRAGRYLRHDGVAAPVMACTCGLAGHYSATEVVGYRATTAGVITIAGRVILHDTWLRAQTAQVEAFALVGTLPDAERLVTERAAAEWGVPILPLGDLADFARSLGHEVPTVLRP